MRIVTNQRPLVGLLILRFLWCVGSSASSSNVNSESSSSSSSAAAETTTASVDNAAVSCPTNSINGVCSEYRWIPDTPHPCTVERISEEEYQRRFGAQGLPPLHPTPIVIQSNQNHKNNGKIFYKKKNNSVNRLRNTKFRAATAFDTIATQFSDDPSTPFFITLSSSNSFSEHRKQMRLSDYLKSLPLNDTLPNQRSNETWYFFGETYSAEWNRLLESYELPNCVACEDRSMVALSFGIGNRGSGVQWHVHGPGFAETIWGRKHWVLQKDQPDFHPDQTSRNWMEYNYFDIMMAQNDIGMETTDRQHSKLLECTLEPGDILYFPDMWYHATINLDPYTAFVSTFTQEHLFVNHKET